MRKRSILAATLILAAGATTTQAEPAWKRIAEKLKQNSLETNSEVVEGEPAFEGPALPEPRVEAAARPAESLVPSPGESFLPEQGTVGMMTQDGQKKGRSGQETMNLGKESEESGISRNLFDDPNVLRMLGEDPRFVYGSVKRPDPMIFPPTRNAAIYAELSLEAERAIEAGNLEAAAVAYKQILDLNDRRYSAEVRSKIAQINAMLGAELAAASTDEEIIVELPSWVRENTRGVLFEEDEPMCLVGDFLLKVGDEVPSYPNVRIGSIDKRQVTFSVSDRESFEVDVKGFEE